MRPAGYLHNLPDIGLAGEYGIFYQYILAANGLFIQVPGALLRLTIRIADVDIRGLAPLEEKIEFVHGRVPDYLGRLALNSMAAIPDREVYMAITWEDDSYHLRMPEQEGHGAGVKYHSVPHTLVQMHSHPDFQSYFSGIDNRDEQGLGIYVVVGEVASANPTILLRAGVYGYFAPLAWEEVFA